MVERKEQHIPGKNILHKKKLFRRSIKIRVWDIQFNRSIYGRLGLNEIITLFFRVTVTVTVNDGEFLGKAIFERMDVFDETSFCFSLTFRRFLDGWIEFGCLRLLFLARSS